MGSKGNPRKAPPARRPPRRAPPATDFEIAVAVYNLHDVYLNATLTHRLMLQATPWVDASRMQDPDPMVRIYEFTRSDRGRLERLWLTCLAVLDEAWRAAALSVVARIRTLVDTARLDSLRSDSQRIAKLVNIRDYMVHRDVREYWDPGRLAPADTDGSLRWNMELHEAFGQVLRPAIDWANPILAASRSGRS